MYIYTLFKYSDRSWNAWWWPPFRRKPLFQDPSVNFRWQFICNWSFFVTGLLYKHHPSSQSTFFQHLRQCLVCCCALETGWFPVRHHVDIWVGLLARCCTLWYAGVVLIQRFPGFVCVLALCGCPRLFGSDCSALPLWSWWQGQGVGMGYVSRLRSMRWHHLWSFIPLLQSSVSGILLPWSLHCGLLCYRTVSAQFHMRLFTQITPKL